MNIGERFYCSRCLAEISDEYICPRCGYDPDTPADESALEEGTTLMGMRFHIGAVRRKLTGGYIYGAFDYVKQVPVYIFEYYPALGLSRDLESESRVIVPPDREAAFRDGMNRLKAGLSGRHESFSGNNTLYVFRP